MPSTTTILLLIYALSTYIVSATPIPDIPPTQQPGKCAGVNITVWNDANCGGHYNSSEPEILSFDSWDRNHFYNKMSYSNTTIQSYMLSRFLSSEERLDWSIFSPSNATSPDPGIPKACGTFVQRTSPDSNNNSLHQYTCYPLHPGATCANLWTTWGPRPRPPPLED